MPDLSIDTVAMADTVSQLDSVRLTLTGTLPVSVSIADHVAHEALGGAVIAFAGAWNAKRHNMIEAVEVVRDAYDDIATTFDTTDGDLAGSL